MSYASLRVVTPPAIEPVSLSLFKRHARIDHDSEDDLCELVYVPTARRNVENYLGRALITQTLSWYIADTTPGPSWPVYPMQELLVLPMVVGPLRYGHKPIEIVRSPVQSVVSVTVTNWYDDTSTLLVLGQDYFVDLQSDPARIRFEPSAVVHTTDGVAITFIAGYGDTPAAVPSTIIAAILLTATALYEHRGDDDGELPRAAQRLCDADRIYSFA